MCKLFRKPKLCDKCANLISKTGREYRCYDAQEYTSYFKKAPSYCKYFKPREATDEQS